MGWCLGLFLWKSLWVPRSSVGKHRAFSEVAATWRDFRRFIF
jgi:hypothetical protein